MLIHLGKTMEKKNLKLHMFFFSGILGPGVKMRVMFNFLCYIVKCLLKSTSLTFIFLSCYLKCEVNHKNTIRSMLSQFNY